MKRLTYITTIIVLTFVLIFLTNTQAQNSTNLPSQMETLTAKQASTNTQVQDSTNLSSGKWTFTAGPYFGTGYNSRPAMVSSVMTHIQRGTITKVQVVNNSSLPISAVKFTWMVTDDPAHQRVLLSGTTQLIPITKQIRPGGYSSINFPVVSFLDLAPKLLRKETGKLEGNFRISVAVTEISFSDGSSWESMISEVANSNEKEVTVQQVAFQKLPKIAKFSVTPFVVPAGSPQACAKQQCSLIEGPPSTYTCIASGLNEFCTNCSTFCCNSICGGPPPGCSCS